MKIASYNVRHLGPKKLNDEDVRNYLIKIVSYCSIIVILEEVNKKGYGMANFLQELNSTGANKKFPYSMTMSSNLGHGNYKEQFVSIVLTDFVLIPVHTKPHDSVKELDELYDVCMAVREKWNIDNIMILGDFNADGAYISKRKMRQIRICTDEEFHWLINEKVDTTASLSNSYTSDRIVVYKDMMKAVVLKSAKPFNFHNAYGQSEETVCTFTNLGSEDQGPLPRGCEPEKQVCSEGSRTKKNKKSKAR